MKKIFYNIAGLILVLYGATQIYFIPYYNWQYARENGFVKWLYFGEIVATGKSLLWPYFKFIAEANQKKMSKQEIKKFIQIKTPLLNDLREYFMLEEAMEIADKPRSSAQRYLQERGFIFKASGKQEEATIDQYLINDFSGQPPVIAVSLLSFGEPQIVRLIVIMMHQRFKEKAIKFIKSAIDSKPAGTNIPGDSAKLHFMGIHRMGLSKLVKISIREDKLKQQTIYSVYYAISEE